MYVHFEHEAEETGDLPAGLEEQFEIPTGVGSPDSLQDQFQDDIEFAEQALAQAVVEAFVGPSHFLTQLFLVSQQGLGAETIGLGEMAEGNAAEEGAVDVFDLVVFTDEARHG
jgi:hypothetical protein